MTLQPLLQGPAGERVSPESASGGAAAAPVRISASDAPGRSASPPHAASPGSAAPTAGGLRGEEEEGPQEGRRGKGGRSGKKFRLCYSFLSIEH